MTVHVKPGHYEIPLEQIRLDGGTQVRAALDEHHIGTLAEAYREGTLRSLPELLLFSDGEAYWLADGFHREAALRQAGKSRAWCEVRIGTQREAQLYSKGANADHGLPRSRADKKRAVVSMLEDPEWSQWSDRAIAKHARVSNTYVSGLRAELAELAAQAGVNVDTSTRKGLDGKTYEVPARSTPATISAEVKAESPSPEQDRDTLLALVCTFDPDIRGTQKYGLNGVRVQLAKRLGYGHVRELPAARWQAMVRAGEDAGLWRLLPHHLELLAGQAPSVDTDLDMDDDSTEAELEEDLGLEFVRIALEQLEAGAAGAPCRQETVCEVALELADLDEVPEEVWQRALALGVERKLWRLSGDVMRRVVETPRAPVSAMPPDELEQSEPVEKADDAATLPNDQRAENDAYWTPDLHARALTRWVSKHVADAWPVLKPRRILEPAAGGGGWVRSSHEVWPGAEVDAYDIDPDAPGLADADSAYPCDFMVKSLMEAAGGPPPRYDLVIGNPPYAGDLMGWIDRSRAHAPVVAYLLRQTILDGEERWKERRPAHVVMVSPRPRWEGPGARVSSDKVGTILVVWVEGHKGPTELHWVDVRELA